MCPGRRRTGAAGPRQTDSGTRRYSKQSKAAQAEDDSGGAASPSKNLSTIEIIWWAGFHCRYGDGRWCALFSEFVDRAARPFMASSNQAVKVWQDRDIKFDAFERYFDV
jgi:hypothetical protein